MLESLILIVIVLVLLIFVGALVFYLVFKKEVTQFFDELQGKSSVVEKPTAKKKHNRDIEANKHHNKHNVLKVDHKKDKEVRPLAKDHRKHNERKDKPKVVPLMKSADRKDKHEVKTKENKINEKHKEKEKQKHQDKPKEKVKPVKKEPPKKIPPPSPNVNKKTVPTNVNSEQTSKAIGTRFGEPEGSDSDKVVRKVGTEEFIPGQGNLQSTIPKPVSKIE